MSIERNVKRVILFSVVVLIAWALMGCNTLPVADNPTEQDVNLDAQLSSWECVDNQDACFTNPEETLPGEFDLDPELTDEQLQELNGEYMPINEDTSSIESLLTPQPPISCTLVKYFDDGVFATYDYKKENRAMHGFFSYRRDSRPMVASLKLGRWNNSNLRANKFINPESVCDFEEFKGHVFANTERAGELFRSGSGVTGWKRVEVFPDGHTGCAVQAHRGKLYASAANSSARSGHVYVSDNGTDWRQVGQNVGYVRELASDGRDLYAFAVNSNDSPRWYVLSNNRWVSKGGNFNKHRVFRTYWDDPRNLMLYTRAKKYGSGSGSVSGLSYFKPSTDRLQHLISDNRYSHFNGAIVGTRPNGNRVIVSSASKGFKNPIGDGRGALFAARYPNVNGGRICTFNENWVTRPFAHNNKCFVSTWRGKGIHGYGATYQINGLRCDYR